jgi:hypothetical protein
MHSAFGKTAQASGVIWQNQSLSVVSYFETEGCLT